jgi:hypothetical protein
MADTVRGLARTLPSCQGDSLSNLWMLIQTVDVRLGQYAWLELRDWRALLAREGAGGWHSSDINESTNRLSYAFATQALLDAFRARAQGLGVPLAALVLTVEARSGPGDRAPSAYERPK